MTGTTHTATTVAALAVIKTAYAAAVVMTAREDPGAAMRFALEVDRIAAEIAEATA